MSWSPKKTEIGNNINLDNIFENSENSKLIVPSVVYLYKVA